MIKKIQFSPKDKEKIESLKTEQTALNNDSIDYTGMVIKKPWGHEHLIFQNNEVAAWVLYLKNGCQTSFHCHLNKKTALVLLSGEALCTTINGEIRLNTGDGLLFDKGVFHCTKALSPEGIILLETETPTNKKDLIRLEDKYGREHQGYEGKEYCSSLDSEEYSWLDSFQGPNKSTDREIKIGDHSLIIKKYKDKNQFRSGLERMDYDTAWLLKGSLLNAQNENILERGDMIGINDLKKFEDINILEEVQFLLIKKIL